MSSEDPLSALQRVYDPENKTCNAAYSVLIKLHFLFHSKKRETGNDRGTKIDLGHAPIFCHVAKCRQRASVG